MTDATRSSPCSYPVTRTTAVTADDLQGFWDMVSFQVEDIYVRFKDLTPLKKELTLHTN